MKIPSAVILVFSVWMPVQTTPAEARDAAIYATEAQCKGDRVLAHAACHMAFANALAEFAAKTPSYRSRRLCLQHFGPCMPWPIGARTFNEFRPQWVGISVEKSAAETAAIPAVAAGRIHLDFAPQSVSSLSAASMRDTEAKKALQVEPVVRIMQPEDDRAEEPASAPAVPGSGFKMIDGVLTYPAPARFQPKFLRRQ